jgi:hypothetical protein
MDNSEPGKLLAGEMVSVVMERVGTSAKTFLFPDQ